MFSLRQCRCWKIVECCLLICVMLSGCGKESKEDVTYKGELLILENISEEINDFFVAGNTLFVVTGIGVEETESITTNLYACNLSVKEVKEVEMKEQDRKKIFLGVSMNNKKRMVLLLGKYEGENILYELVGLDENGKEICRVDVNAVAGIEKTSYVTECLITENGSMILGVDNHVVVINESGEKAFDLKMKSGIEGMVQTETGKILCACNTEEGACVECLDMDGKQWDEPILLERKIEYGNALMQASEYEFAYRSDDGIYGYFDGKSEKIMDFHKSGIEKNTKVVFTGKDIMIGMDMEATQLMSYHKVQVSDQNQKTTITLGSVDGNSELRNQILSFNKHNKKYEIEYIDYSQSEDPMGKWNTDITAGKIPDIIDLSGLSIEQYVQKGLLEDLTSYFQNDADIKEEDIIDSVREAMKINGKLFYVSPSFLIFSIMGEKNSIGERKGWTFQELQEFTQKNKNPFVEKKKQDILNVFVYTNIPQLINWETGECKFDSEEFKEILQYCNMGENDGEDIDWSQLPELIANGEVKLNNGEFAIEDIQFYQKMFGMEMTFVGFPDEDKNGSFFSFDSCLGISSKCGCKDGAWEFLKQLMTKDFQCDQESMFHTPTRQDAYDCMIEQKSAKEEYTDDWGNTIQPLKQAKKFGTFYLEIEPLSQEEIQTYTSLVQSTNKIISYDEKIMEIIKEEAEGYFTGDKELEETVRVIQNRISLYVNEQR